MPVSRNLPLLAVLSASLLVACDRPKPAASAPPPPKVTVAKPIVRDITQWDEYTGRLEAVESVDVRAQVSGFVDSVSFTEGALVNKGDLLLTIDSRVFQAQLDNAQALVEQAKAQLRLAQATLELGENDLKRGAEAARTGGISNEELDTRRATVAQNEASVGAAQAAIAVAKSQEKSAQNYVDWCKVTAPISGRISNRHITPGNMLTGGSGTTTLITTIVSADPIYCYVDVDEASVLKYQMLSREKRRVSAQDAAIPCFMGLANESGFPHTGAIDFVDNQINPTTGTRRARGVFPNPDGTLLPGFFARFRVAGEELHNGMLVTDECVGVDQDRKFIYVMHPDKTVERRIVDTGPLIDGLRVIKSGLQPDEWVLINGISSLAMAPPGGTVNPDMVPMPEQTPVTATATAPATASTRPAQAPTEAAK